MRSASRSIGAGVCSGPRDFERHGARLRAHRQRRRFLASRSTSRCRCVSMPTNSSRSSALPSRSARATTRSRRRACTSTSSASGDPSAPRFACDDDGADRRADRHRERRRRLPVADVAQVRCLHRSADGDAGAGSAAGTAGAGARGGTRRAARQRCRRAAPAAGPPRRGAGRGTRLAAREARAARAPRAVQRAPLERRAATVPARRSEARAKAAAAPASAGGPRLQLEAAQMLARPAPAASATPPRRPASRASIGRGELRSAAQAASQPVADAASVQEGERLRQLEDSLAKLKADGDATRSQLAAPAGAAARGRGRAPFAIRWSICCSP